MVKFQIIPIYIYSFFQFLIILMISKVIFYLFEAKMSDLKKIFLY